MCAVIPGTPCRALFSLLELNVDFQLFSITEDGYWHDVADLTAAKGVSEIVKILDGLVTKLNQNISGLEASLCRRRAWLYVRKLYAIFGLAKIGNGAEVRPIAAATASRAGMRIVFDNRTE